MSEFRIASIGRAYPSLTVMTRAIVFGQWAAHPTGVQVEQPDGDEGEKSVRVFAEWGLTHTVSGRSPVVRHHLEWYEAVAIAQALDAAFPEGIDPRRLADGKARFDEVIESALQSAEAAP